MFFLNDVFGILTLQTSTIIFSSLFTTLAVCVLIVNLLSFEADVSGAWIIMFLFVSLMIIIWLIAFVGAYKESNKITSVACILWTVYVILWIGLVMSSLTNKSISCIEFRCADGLWLLYSSRCDLYSEQLYNASHKNGFSKDQNNYIPPQYEKTVKPKVVEDKKNDKSISKTPQNNTTTVLHVTMPYELVENFENNIRIREVKTNIKMIDAHCEPHFQPKNHLASTIASIIFSFLYALLLLFSWMVLISYRVEIHYQTDFTINVQEITPIH